MTTPTSTLSPATLASRRHLARIAVRVCVVLCVFAAFHRLVDTMSGYGPNNMSGWLDAFSGFGLPVFAWFVPVPLLILAENRLVLWLVPQPRPGCPNCGYDTRSLRSPICPECGENLRPPAATPRQP